MINNILAVFRCARGRGYDVYDDLHISGRFAWPLTISSVDMIRQQCAKRLDASTDNVVILNIIQLADSPEPQPEGE